MSFDPVVAVGLVVREVRVGVRDGAATKIAVARRAYQASQADLWDALTNAERIPRWFLPVSGDLRVGGRYQLAGNAGGVVEQCKEPESFAITWEYGGMMSWLEVTLTPDGEHTTLELTYEAHVDPEFWGQYGPGATGVGWDLTLLGLERHLETGAQVDPRTALSFPTSPDGVAFVQTAATGWAEAAVADGDDPGAARQAADRTVTFYTVIPGNTGTGTGAPGDGADR
jgi:uncharacterized protein YndB with AHSA1/START domain